MSYFINKTFCTECMGLGVKEKLIELDKPTLDKKGQLIRYIRQTVPCQACSKPATDIKKPSFLRIYYK